MFNYNSILFHFTSLSTYFYFHTFAFRLLLLLANFCLQATFPPLVYYKRSFLLFTIQTIVPKHLFFSIPSFIFVHYLLNTVVLQDLYFTIFWKENRKLSIYTRARIRVCTCDIIRRSFSCLQFVYISFTLCSLTLPGQCGILVAQQTEGRKQPPRGRK